MKPIITIFLIFWATSLVLGQSSIEFSVGPNWSNVSLKGLDESFRPQRTMHTGLAVQAMLHHDFEASAFGFSTGVAYKEKGFIIDENLNMDVLNIPLKIGLEANTTLQYVEIPLNLKYTVASGPLKAYIFAGPSVGYALHGDVRTKANFLVDININKTDLNLNDKIFNRFELGANLGIGSEVSVGSGSIIFQANYNQGLNKVIDNTLIDLKLKNYGFGVSIGYKIPLR